MLCHCARLVPWKAWSWALCQAGTSVSMDMTRPAYQLLPRQTLIEQRIGLCDVGSPACMHALCHDATADDQATFSSATQVLPSCSTCQHRKQAATDASHLPALGAQVHATTQAPPYVVMPLLMLPHRSRQLSIMQHLAQHAGLHRMFATSSRPVISEPSSTNATVSGTTQEPLHTMQPYSREEHQLSFTAASGLQLARKSFTLERYRLPQYSGDVGRAELLKDPQLRAAAEIISRLRAAGHSAYIAGGWVRDAMLGRPPNDVDIATSASVTDDLPRLFSERGVRQLQRATARIAWSSGVAIEIAQLRGFVRKPTLECAYLDACLRDFTINSLFYDPWEGEVLDFVGGGRDLAARVLRLPPHHISHTPSTVVGDDPLRVLRALRFAASLGLTIEPSTEAALVAHAGRLQLLGGHGTSSTSATSSALNARRVARELAKLCTVQGKGGGPPPGPNAPLPRAFARAAEWGLLGAMVPDAYDASMGGGPSPSQVAALQGVLPLDAPLELRIACLVNPWAEHGLAALTNIQGHMLGGGRGAGSGGPTPLAWDGVGVLEDMKRMVTHLGHLYREVESVLQREGKGMPADVMEECEVVLRACDPHLKSSLTVCLASPHAPAIEAWLLTWLPDTEVDYSGLAHPDKARSNEGAGITRSPRATVAAHLAAMRQRWGTNIAQRVLDRTSRSMQGLAQQL